MANSFDKQSALRKYVYLGINAASLIITFVLLFTGMGTYNPETVPVVFKPIGFLFGQSTRLDAVMIMMALLVLFAVHFAKLLRSLRALGDEELFAKRVTSAVTFGTAVAGSFSILSILYGLMCNMTGYQFTTRGNFVPLIIDAILLIVLAILNREEEQETETGEGKSNRSSRAEFFVYGLMTTVFTVIACVSDILNVTFYQPVSLDAININGWDLLTTYNTLGSGFQMMAFLLLAILAVMVSLLLASAVSFISRSRLFYQFTLIEMICAFTFSLLLGIYGKYYEVVQLLNREMILQFIQDYLNTVSVTFDYHVSSPALYWFFAVLAVVLFTVIRKPYSRGVSAEMLVKTAAAEESGETKGKASGDSDLFEKTKDVAVTPSGLSGSQGDGRGMTGASGATGMSRTVPAFDDDEFAPAEEKKANKDEDPCPAFTELDEKNREVRAKLRNAQQRAFPSPSLPALVRHVVDFAREDDKRLSYSEQDIATFVAGLGATRLSILQGMSGTGKTSLPLIFTKAIFGHCDVVEVESSWRDKNELLGYYNEFSRTYTPKKFTQALYAAALNGEQTTLIVLDEMNLSRIEYYFSDFLSLMENEEDKREIKLVNVKLRRTEGGRKIDYQGLVDGHTLKVPRNVWFIGTANRDESTFEISDKVYDRAHTMNFNKRAPEAIATGQAVPEQYLSASAFLALLDNAKKSSTFKVDDCQVIKDVEKLLEPYNISFGNRIARQIRDFVSIYCACFAPSDAVRNEAIERILLSKVVCKLELKSLENKEQLALEFKKLGLNRCYEFVMKLNED